MKSLKNLVKTDTLNVEELMTIKGAAESGAGRGCDKYACKSGACDGMSCIGNTCNSYACESNMDSAPSSGTIIVNK